MLGKLSAILIIASLIVLAVAADRLVQTGLRPDLSAASAVSIAKRTPTPETQSHLGPVVALQERDAPQRDYYLAAVRLLISLHHRSTTSVCIHLLPARGCICRNTASLICIID